MKTMKRFIAAVMAVTSVMALAPMSAFADTTEVKFNAPRNSPEFTITIPASVDLNAETPTATITAENVYLDTTKHKQINVTLDSAQYVETGASTFIAKTEDGNSQVTYTIGKGTATTGISVGDTVATFTNNPDETASPDVQTATLTFSEPTGATYAGTHTETLTFGIAVENAITTRTVTWNASDIVTENPWDKSFTKDGITFAPGHADFLDKNFANGGTFTTASGKFTKIEVTAPYVNISGTGWSGRTWTGDASSSVSYSGDIYDVGMGQLKIVFTIEE